MPDPVVRARLRRNKANGVRWEKDAAAVLGTERYLANTGGPIDLIPIAGLKVQVKGGKAVVTEVMRVALASATAGCKTGELPAVYLIDTRDARNHHWICFEAKSWSAWNGFGPKDDTPTPTVAPARRGTGRKKQQEQPSGTTE